MKQEPDALLRDEDFKLLRDIIEANDKAQAGGHRVLIATMASNIASDVSPHATPEYLNALAKTSVRLARAILAEVDRGE